MTAPKAGPTPGPWEDVGANEEFERCIYGADDSAVAVTIPVNRPDKCPERSIANARLIAAAPDLLESLQQLLKLNGHWERGNAYISAAFVEQYEKIAADARAALAKAVQP